MKYSRLKTDHYYLVNSLSLLHLDLARSRVDTLGYFRLDGNQYLSSKYLGFLFYFFSNTYVSFLFI